MKKNHLKQTSELKMKAEMKLQKLIFHPDILRRLHGACQE